MSHLINMSCTGVWLDFRMIFVSRNQLKVFLLSEKSEAKLRINLVTSPPTHIFSLCLSFCPNVFIITCPKSYYIQLNQLQLRSNQNSVSCQDKNKLLICWEDSDIISLWNVHWIWLDYLFSTHSLYWTISNSHSGVTLHESLELVKGVFEKTQNSSLSSFLGKSTETATHTRYKLYVCGINFNFLLFSAQSSHLSLASFLSAAVFVA